MINEWNVSNNRKRRAHMQGTRQRQTDTTELTEMRRKTKKK